MKYCPNCKVGYEAAFAHCPQCGGELTEIEVSGNVANPTPIVSEKASADEDKDDINLSLLKDKIESLDTSILWLLVLGGVPGWIYGSKARSMCHKALGAIIKGRRYDADRYYEEAKKATGRGWTIIFYISVILFGLILFAF